MAGRPQNSPRGLFAKKEIRVASAVGEGRILAPVAAKPSTDEGIAMVLVRDSTGRVNIAVNTTGTTWAYMATTSLITG